MAAEDWARLHRSALTRASEILAVLEGAHRAGAVLRAGMDSRNSPRTARIASIASGVVQLHTRNIQRSEPGPLYFRFECSGIQYFFAATRTEGASRGAYAIRLPPVIYQAERRELPRIVHAPHQPARVQLRSAAGQSWIAEVVDTSYQGIGASVQNGQLPELGSKLDVHFLDGERAGEAAYALLRNRAPAGAPTGWTRLGLSVSSVPYQDEIAVSRQGRLVPAARATRAWRELAVAGARAAPSRLIRRLGIPRAKKPEINVLQFENELGQPIRAIIDSTGDRSGSTAVVIPPAWGRTKETLLPLASILIETFKKAGEPLTVVRFDGTYRRGESYIPPGCRRPGFEAMHFTFSRALRDLLATVDYLHRSPSLRPAKIVLVTFSLASIEGRRAVALNPSDRIAGWISVVGMADLQSGLRAVSGGIDYGYGLLRDVRFGVHHLGGVLIDMDRAGRDVLEHQLGYLEDARRDMGNIRVPVTWIHGRHDGWIDIQRVREIMSAGQRSHRKLVEVPTGHQLRTSRQALETFQIVAREVSRMALGRALQPRMPDLIKLEERAQAERARKPPMKVNLNAFWHDYLLGRDGRIGIEFLTATKAYRKLMNAQIPALELKPGDTILDLGAGTGEFIVELARRPNLPRPVRVIAVDLVAQGLMRGRRRLSQEPFGSGLIVDYIAADLSLANAGHLPLADVRADGVLASLLLSYLPRPEALLRAIYRVLRPGGRLVLSTPRRDADLSKIYIEGRDELGPSRVRELFGEEIERDFEVLQREFLNNGARLLDLEEEGLFRFWDPAELATAVRRAGFQETRTADALGSPAQVVLLTAVRP